jgi:glycosyltransferase involved in cell wall biosynthesis
MMQDRPLVTAVMIFLNGEKYIAEAIESVLAQTYANWELVLVDDGSTDNATAIALDYARRDPERIRYIDHPGHENRGMSASRNAGVRAGRGDYVSFLDADDIWLPGRLERFVEVAQAFPGAGMIYGPTLYWYSWAKARGVPPPVEGQEDFPGHLDLPAGRLIPPPVPMRQFLLSNGGCLPGICSLLVRRDTYDAVGGFEESFRGLYEDQAFLSKMALAHPVVVIEEVLDHYRQHTESCCHRGLETGEYHPENYHPARHNYLLWLKDHWTRTGARDRVIDRELRRQLRPYRWPWIARSVNVLQSVHRRVRRGLRRLLPGFVTDRVRAALRALRNHGRQIRLRRASD